MAKEETFFTIEEINAKISTEEDKLIMDFLHGHPRRRQEILSDAIRESKIKGKEKNNEFVV